MTDTAVMPVLGRDDDGRDYYFDWSGWLTFGERIIESRFVTNLGVSLTTFNATATVVHVRRVGMAGTIINIVRTNRRAIPVARRMTVSGDSPARWWLRKLTTL